VYILPEDGHRSGPKLVVAVHNKIEHKKYLLRTVVLIKVLVDTRATGCITQQLRKYSPKDGQHVPKHVVNRLE
jgi:hypothetical protein